MKKFILSLILLIPIISFSQSKSTPQSFVSQNKDTLILLENNIGKGILNLWIENGSYVEKTQVIASDIIFNYWQAKDKVQKPQVIFLVDIIGKGAASTGK